MRGDVLYNDATCADGDIIANGDTWQDGYAAANPHVIADGDWLCPLLTGVALHWVCAVTCSIDADVRTNETVVADGDRSLIEYYEIEVGKETLAHADLLTIVAEERLVNENLVVTNMAQQPFKYRQT